MAGKSPVKSKAKSKAKVKAKAKAKTAKNNGAKTQATRASVTSFLDHATSGERRADCAELVRMMEAATGAKAVLWGSNIVGFGLYRYEYASGRTGDWPIIGFSPRKTDLTLYIMAGYGDFGPLLAKLGPHKIGKSCLYVKSLGSLDRKVLGQLLAAAVKAMAAKRVA
jgi:Domain of unknown function (DU1801)